MTRHAQLAELSSYLDGELPDGHRRELAEHVSSCPRCRDRLSGLRQTVERLREVEPENPPNELAARVHRRLALEHGRPGPLRAIEQWLAQWRPAPELIAGAAVIIALAAIAQIYVSGGAAFEEQDGVTAAPAPQATPTLRDSRAVEESPRHRLEPPPPAATRESSPVRAVAGHRFQLRGDAWIEEGADVSPPDRDLTWAQARAEGILEAAPQLTRFRDGDRPVVIRHGNQVIRIVPTD